MRALGIGGLSVTMPHKEAAAAVADELTDDARLLGAVNCIVDRDGTLVGHNTDGAGLLAALAADVDYAPHGARCVVLGAGGAARAAVLALARADAAEIVVVARRPDAAAVAAQLAGEAGAVVDARGRPVADRRRTSWSTPRRSAWGTRRPATSRSTSTISGRARSWSI